MEERLRLAYLEAMGVDVYLPRVALPGARQVALRAVLQAERAEPAARRSVAPHEQATAPAAGQAPAEQLPGSESRARQRPSALLEGLLPRASASAPTETGARGGAAVSSGPSTGAGSEPRRAAIPAFRLQLSVASADVLFISDASIDAPTNQALQLLEAIRAALGLGQEQRMATTFYRWPIMPKMPAGESQWPMLTESLDAFIERQFDQHKPAAVVIFGHWAANLLLNREPPASGLSPEQDLQADWWQAMLGTTHSLAAVRERVLVTHGIDLLIRKPELKRQTWQHLRAQPGLVRSRPATP